MSPYQTHLPILNYALDRYNDVVLEFGGGEFSTPLIINKSKESITFENNYDWFQKILNLKNEKHRIYHDKDYIGAIHYQWLHHPPTWRYSLAFVDGDNWKQRCELVDYLSDKCEVVMLHDSFPEHIDRCVAHLGHTFKYVYTMNVYPFYDGQEIRGRPEYPPTLVLSNFNDFKDWSIHV